MIPAVPAKTESKILIGKPMVMAIEAINECSFIKSLTASLKSISTLCATSIIAVHSNLPPFHI